MAAPPGWYQDPSGTTEHRFWDGTSRTTALRQAEPPAPPKRSRLTVALICLTAAVISAAIVAVGLVSLVGFANDVLDPVVVVRVVSVAHGEVCIHAYGHREAEWIRSDPDCLVVTSDLRSMILGKPPAWYRVGQCIKLTVIAESGGAFRNHGEKTCPRT